MEGLHRAPESFKMEGPLVHRLYDAAHRGDGLARAITPGRQHQGCWPQNHTGWFAQGSASPPHGLNVPSRGTALWEPAIVGSSNTPKHVAGAPGTASWEQAIVGSSTTRCSSFEVPTQTHVAGAAGSIQRHSSKSPRPQSAFRQRTSPTACSIQVSPRQPSNPQSDSFSRPSNELMATYNSSWAISKQQQQGQMTVFETTTPSRRGYNRRMTIGLPSSQVQPVTPTPTPKRLSTGGTNICDFQSTMVATTTTGPMPSPRLVPEVSPRPLASPQPSPPRGPRGQFSNGLMHNAWPQQPMQSPECGRSPRLFTPQPSPLPQPTLPQQSSRSSLASIQSPRTRASSGGHSFVPDQLAEGMRTAASPPRMRTGQIHDSSQSSLIQSKGTNKKSKAPPGTWLEPAPWQRLLSNINNRQYLQQKFCTMAAAKADVGSKNALNLVEVERLVVDICRELYSPLPSHQALKRTFKKHDPLNAGLLQKDAFPDFFLSLLVRIDHDQAQQQNRTCDFFILKRGNKPWDLYNRSDKLDQGRFGMIWVDERHQVAVNVVDKVCALASPQEMERQLLTLRASAQPEIVKPFEWFEDYKHVYLTIGLHERIELLQVIEDTFLKPKLALTEEWISAVFRQCLIAMDYCHQHQVLHLDFRLEVISLENLSDIAQRPRAVVKDFGYAELFGSQGDLGYAGSSRSRNTKPKEPVPSSDILSVGCCILQMLVGVPCPKSESKDNGLLAARSWESQDLLKTMLSEDENRRASAKCCLEHQWLQRPPLSAAPLDVDSISRLVTVEHQARLRRDLCFRAACMVKEESTFELGRAPGLFSQWNGPGQLQRQDLQDALDSFGLGTNSIQWVIDAFDENPGNSVGYGEFRGGFLSVCEGILREQLWMGWTVADTEGSGWLPSNEVHKIIWPIDDVPSWCPSSLGLLPNEHNATLGKPSEQIMVELENTSGQGGVFFDDFCKYFMPGWAQEMPMDARK